DDNTFFTSKRRQTISKRDWSSDVCSSDLQFDVIFLDPPYEKGLIDEALDGIAKFNLLKENGIIVCEFNHKEKIDTKSFHMIKRYHYGLTDTLLLEKGD